MESHSKYSVFVQVDQKKEKIANFPLALSRVGKITKIPVFLYRLYKS